jgi:hypothetical protein
MLEHWSCLSNLVQFLVALYIEPWRVISASLRFEFRVAEAVQKLVMVP